MKFMKRKNLRMFAVAALLPLMAVHSVSRPLRAAAVVAPADQAVVDQLTKMLRDFLAAVPRSDRQVFDNFFADDVIYTRGAGVTVDKAGIMKNIGVRAANEPNDTYEADDITVHPYGNMAVVNFRLVQHTEEKGVKATNYFRNTGTFLKRNDKWQVVAWQATRVPPAEKQ